MKIELRKITVRELSEGYEDNAEDGVSGYGCKLDIRPPYQREFIYKPEQRDAVIDTINKDFPLNVMYWAVREDGNYEIIDGQQRTISICQYVKGDFAHKKKYFHNLQDDEQEKILNYELMIYWCSGTNTEKLEWFRIINIAGEKLTDQELRNAVYSGPWICNAKRYFSKNNCQAHNLAKDYLKCAAIRQEYLETAIKWHSKNNIEEHMAEHQHDTDASKLWNYFREVINWVETTFEVKRKDMKNVDWGPLYDKYKDEQLDAKEIEKKIQELILNKEVTKPSGIYPYILTRDERHLNLRMFEHITKQQVYELQKGICVKCGEHFELDGMEADHIKPWSEGGRTEEDNCQLLCKDCNRRKSSK